MMELNTSVRFQNSRGFDVKSSCHIEIVTFMPHGLLPKHKHKHSSRKCAVFCH